MAVLAIVSQNIDIEIFNSIVTLQSKLAFLKNRANLGVIDDEVYLRNRAKVSLATMELLSELEKSKSDYGTTLKKRVASFENILDI